MKKSKIISDKIKLLHGFSLIELSLTLIVIGSLALVAVTKIVQKNEIDRNAKVTEDLKEIRDAIDSFVKINGYYPCPATPGIPNTDPNFAVAAVNDSMFTNNLIQYCGTPNNIGTQFNSTVKKFNSTDDNFISTNDFTGTLIMNAFTADMFSSAINIFMGDVPCKDIGLQDDCGISPEGNKYAYIVSGHLTMSPRNDFFNNVFVSGCSRACIYTGTPGFYDEKKASRIKPLRIWDVATPISDTSLNDAFDASNAEESDYALIDYGKNGLGAYNTAGGQNNSNGASAYEKFNFKPEFDQNGNPDTMWINEFIYAPLQPNDVRTNASSQFFDDIVLLGGKDSRINARYCVDCREWGGTSLPFPNTAPPFYTDQYMLLLEDITSCTDPAIQEACEALP
jgi:prepilin-type N-terminal cleavage/methylation domain-containing protein